VCLAQPAPYTAQQPDDRQPSILTSPASEAMTPRRDGVRLYPQIYRPKKVSEPLPFILSRTPYGTGQPNPTRLAASLPELSSEGYIVVLQDIRGRFKSEGQFVMIRQPRDPNDKNAIDES